MTISLRILPMAYIKYSIKRLCLLFFCIMLTIYSLPMNVLAKNSDKATVMRIEEAVGTVNINSTKAQAGMQLYSGDTVTTASSSFSHVSLDSSKLVKISQKSQASISKSGKKLEISLVSGEIFFDVKKKLSDDESMKLNAGSVAMSVRGTSGIVRIEADGIRISVYDGVVDIACTDGKFTMWGGETVSFNLDGTIKTRDLVDVKRMSEFEDQVIATDADVIDRASANINVNLPIARYNERMAGKSVEAVTEQLVAPVVEPKITDTTTVSPEKSMETPKKGEKQEETTKPVQTSTSSDNSHSDSHDSSNDHSSSSSDDHSSSSSDDHSSSSSDDHSGGDSGGSSSDSCDHSYTYNYNGDGHTKTCEKCGQTSNEAHSLTYTKMSSDRHLAECTLCGYDSGEVHSFDVSGHFNEDGNTTEETSVYYTRKCKCGLVDEGSREESSGTTCLHASKNYNHVTDSDTHEVICVSCLEHLGTFSCQYNTEYTATEEYQITEHVKCSNCNYEKDIVTDYNPSNIYGYVYEDENYHKVTSSGTSPSSQEHSWANKYGSETHQYCTLCGFENFTHSYVDGKYTLDGTLSLDATFGYYQKCSVEACGALRDIFGYTTTDDGTCTTHDYEYIYYLPDSCEKICKICHYNSGKNAHVFISGIFNKVSGASTDVYYTQKCKNCSYLKPDSIVTRVK